MSSIQVHASLTPPSAPYHRSAVYAIVAEGPADAKLTMPEFPKGYEGLEVRQHELTTEDLPNNRKRFTQAWSLDAIAPKTYAIPPMQVTLGDGKTLGVPALAFEARDLTPEEQKAAQEFVGIVTPDSLPPAHGSPWAVAALALAILAGIAAGVYLYRRFRKPAPAPPPLPAWDVALRRLRELSLRQLPQAGRVEQYYVDLSAILRYYVEDRFALHAPEMTTPEFLDAAARGGRLSPGQQDFLAHFLRHCDRVKFARYEPSECEMEDSYVAVEAFVRETIPRPGPDPALKPVEAPA